MDKKIVFLITILFLVTNVSCAQKKQLKYLALGDSYTIGESVDENKRWPVQLVKELNKEGFAVAAPKIIAKTGWTTNELQDSIEKQNPDDDYDLVSLLIGVNNQYRGYPINQYKKEFEELLVKAISLADEDSDKVFVVSIPNYGVTPFGIKKGEDSIRQELLIYDSIADSISSAYDIAFINITPVSEKAKVDKSFIANDQLHPSGKQYTEWVQLITPVAKTILKTTLLKKEN